MKCLHRLLLLPFSLLLVRASAQTYTFDPDPICQAAYQHYMALRIDEGNTLIRQAIRQNPYNLMPVYLADYDDCLTLMLNGDPKDYEQRKSHYEERLAVLEKGPESSPWYRFCRAGLHLHWALVRVRFGEQFKAATTFRKSYLNLKENAQKFPDFEYNRIFLGLEEAIAGTIPDDYKWLASIFGMKGNVNRGIARITSFVNAHPGSGEIFREEAVLFQCYLRFYLQMQQDQVWQYVSSNQYPIASNLLHALVRTNIALNHRHADAALQALRQAQSLKDYSRFPIMDYEMGNALFLRLDESCISWYQRFLGRFRGRWYVKDAWEKMALSWYLLRNQEKAKTCRTQVKKQGNTQVDADKQAQRHAESNTWPNELLLQSRLLCDGGFYTQALARMSGSREADFGDIANQLEYNFRMGRICDELNDDNKALAYYQAAITKGREREEHFAARSALQMGFIYERHGQKVQALTRYKEALSMRHHDFQSSIDQQAKAGIDRLSNH